jgi:ABC-2 type transport system permease protein
VSLVAAHARASIQELGRYPAYVVPTLLFPAMFFVFFGSSARGEIATLGMCSFAAFAVIGVAFFQFGVGIAVERGSPWETFLRTLPVSPRQRILARLLCGALFAAASAAIVVAAALATTDAALDAARWLELVVVLLAGVVPFGLLGIALGYWATPKSALPLANVLYLALAYAGGLWVRPAGLPEAVYRLSPYLPTRHLADILAGVARGSPWRPGDWLALACFTLVFAAAAVAGYRRDELRRFR